jgi:hypothetical protein
MAPTIATVEAWPQCHKTDENCRALELDVELAVAQPDFVSVAAEPAEGSRWRDW